MPPSICWALLSRPSYRQKGLPGAGELNARAGAVREHPPSLEIVGGGGSPSFLP